MEHPRDSLSAFIDGQLAAGEKARVEAHLGGCPFCRAELDELKAVSKLVCGLPQRPLPAGFLQRLEKRRAAEAAPEAEKRSPHLLPFPLRVAAFALSSFVVVYAVWDKVQERRLADSGLLAGRGAEEAPAPAAAPQAGRAGRSSRPARLRPSAGPLAKTDEAFSGGGGPLDSLVVDRNLSGSEGGAVSGDRRPPSDENAGESRDMPVPTLDGGGAPAGQALPKPQPTNEALQGFLNKERDKMGIRDIVPPGSEDRAQAAAQSEPPPMSRAEARAYMRQMAAAMEHERRAMTRTPEPVPIGAGQKPRLLAKKESASGAAAGVPLEAAAEATPATPPAELKQAAGKDLGPGLVLKTGDELAALWERYKISDPLPAVDFSEEMLVGLFAPDKPAGFRFQIESAKERSGRLAVQYKEITGSVAEGPSATAYALRVVPKSGLPVVFERLP